MECRTFKIIRMIDIHVTEDSCIHQSSQELTHESVSETSKKQINLNLKISSQGAYRVYDDFSEDQIKINEDGSYTVLVSLPEGEWLYNYLFSFGTALEVIEPKNVRENIICRLEQLTNKYHSKT